MTLLELAEAHAQLSQAYFRAVALQEREARASKAALELENVKAQRAELAKEIASQEEAIAKVRSDITVLSVLP